MKTRRLGNTDLDLSVVSFGASSLGAEFRSVDVNEALSAVPAAIDCGMNFIDFWMDQLVFQHGTSFPFVYIPDCRASRCRVKWSSSTAV